MPRAATAQRNFIRTVVQIGQVWKHDGEEFSVQIKQIHRADRLVEACIVGRSGRERRPITFADLQREYELVEARDAA
jgi:hypothetical protein